MRLLGPDPTVATLPLAAFTVDGVPHALVAARLSAEYGIGVRHGCFCAHPYLMRLLDLSADEITAYRHAVRAGDRRRMPGAVRASAGINTAPADIDRLLAAVADIAGGRPTARPLQPRTPPPATTGPRATAPGWTAQRPGRRRVLRPRMTMHRADPTTVSPR